MGVSGAGSFSDYSVRYLLSKNGMTPADIKTAALGAGPAQIAGLTGGTAAAVMLQSPAFEQQQSDDAIQIVHNFREDGPMPAIVAIGRTDEVTKRAREVHQVRRRVEGGAGKDDRPTRITP